MVFETTNSESDEYIAIHTSYIKGNIYEKGIF